MSEPIWNCAICGEYVSLQDAKTDGNGRAVHEGCLVKKLHEASTTEDQESLQS
jgi:hypothetical protein